MHDGHDSWVGRRVTVDIDAVAHGGHCVARVQGRVVFVRHTLPGERVTAVVTEDRGGSFCRADAVEILHPAAGRVEPPCPLAGPGKCGGCDWQHATADTQRRMKAAVVAEQLHRLAGIDTDVEVEPLPGGTLGWRSRIKLIADDQGKLGLRVHRSHSIVALDEHGCAITMPGALDDVLARVWPAGSEVAVTRDVTGTNHVRSVDTVRARARSTQNTRSTHHRGGTAREHAAGRDWTVRADGFWQVHPHAADTLAQVVADWADLGRGARAWDLYAGVGLFTSVLADQVGPTGSVLAVESSRQAVADGQRNLADMSQVSWRCGGVAAVLGADRPQAPDVVVLDPPRKGAGRSVVGAITAAAAARVVYVACDPAALARDVATFVTAGYELTAVRAFDAFPMTHHVECVALLRAG